MEIESQNEYAKPRGEVSELNGFVRFDPADVRKVASALLEHGVWHEDYGDSFPYEGYECQCCDGDIAQKEKDFKHKLDCPILVAQDLITRI